MKLYDFTSFLEISAKQASDVAMSHFGKVTVSVKPEDNNQVLTDADIAIGKMLVQTAQEFFPDFNIIDEEAGVIDKGSSYTVVIDPIDGTSNFANGLPLFGVFVGILHDAVPIAGTVALPAFNEVYIAQKGKGAYRNGTPVHTSGVIDLKDALIAYGIDGHQDNPELTYSEAALLGKIVLAIRNLRTSNSAFDIAAVADGRYGLVMNMTSKVWDNVAPQVVIEEAGGTFTDYYGRPMDYKNVLKSPGDNFTVCAGAPLLHSAMQSIIHGRVV